MDVIPLNESFDKSKLSHNQQVLWQDCQRMKQMNKQSTEANQ